MTAYFNYHGGGFPLDQAAYTVTEDAVIINVAGVAAPIIIDEPMDAQRFGEAVVAADVHFRWPGRGLPRCGTSYQIDPALYSYFNAVTVRWAGVEQRLEGDEAAAFLRAAGVYRVCDRCDRPRIIPEPDTNLCRGCSYRSADLLYRPQLLLGVAPVTEASEATV